MPRAKRDTTIPCPAGCGADLSELASGEEHYCAAVEGDDGHTHSFSPAGRCTEPGCDMTVEQAIQRSARAPLDPDEEMSDPVVLAEPVAVAELASCVTCDKPIPPEEAAQHSGMCGDCSGDQAALVITEQMATPPPPPPAEPVNACPMCGQEFATREFVQKHVDRKHADGIGRQSAGLAKAIQSMAVDPQPAAVDGERTISQQEANGTEPVLADAGSVYSNGTGELPVQNELRAIIAEIATLSSRLGELHARLTEILRSKGAVLP